MKSAQPSENPSTEKDSPSRVFGDYAQVYDYLYHGKDYEAECGFLESLLDRFSHVGVRSILDMGCGTGGHALPMARRGYNITGIDISGPMISAANEKKGEAPGAGKLDFKTADIRHVNLKKKFDAAVSMFSVFSYQTGNDDAMSALKAARRHVRKGGLFIFDFWYGPAVLKERPSVRVKDIRIGEDHIIRSVHPETDPDKNEVRVRYHVIHLRDGRLLRDIRETHTLRYFFMPELSFFLSKSGFTPVHACPFGAIDDPVNENTWNVTLVARAV